MLSITANEVLFFFFKSITPNLEMFIFASYIKEPQKTFKESNGLGKQGTRKKRYAKDHTHQV